MERRLATILAADAVGYSRLVGANEEETLALLRTCRSEIDAAIERHSGRLFGSAGDSVIAEFPGPVAAARAALEAQTALETLNRDLPEDRRMRFRFGAHIGDVVAEGDNLLGDGVNIAARLEAAAPSGGVCVSAQVAGEIAGKVGADFARAGPLALRNIARPVEAWVWPASAAAAMRAPVRRRRAGLAAGLIAAAGAALAIGLTTLGTAPEDTGAPPSVAVLPFDNLTEGGARQHVADGLTTDIIADLSRFRRVQVLSANSSFAYRGQSVTAQKVAEDLGVAYVVDGAVRAPEGRLRVTVELIEAASGRTLWSSKFDKSSDDLFAVLDEINRELAATLVGRIDQVEERAALARPTDSAEAYDLYLQANHRYLTDSKEGYRDAVRLLGEALAKAPDFANAKGRLAWILWQGANWGWADDAEADRARAFELAREAVAIAPDDYQNHATLAFIHLNRKEYDQAQAALDRARALGPNDPDLLVDAAQIPIYLNRPEEAVELVEQAIRLNPLHPEWYYGILGWALYDAGRYEAAVATMRRMAQPRAWIHRMISAALVALDRIDEAKAEMLIVLKKDPGFRLSGQGGWPYRDPAILEITTERYRIAGAPE